MSGTNQVVSTPPKSYIEREINYIFQLGTGNFGDSGSNTVKVTGLRSQATITGGVGNSMAQVEARVFGLTPVIMNSLSALSMLNSQIRNNVVTIIAGDALNGMSTVFNGNFTECYQDLNSQPDTCLVVIGNGAVVQAAQPVAPVSVQGTSDVASVMKNIAASNTPPLGFTNNGVNVKIKNLYLAGTPWDQAQTLAHMADAVLTVSSDGTTWILTPLNGNAGGTIPLISAATGMIGYPKYSSNSLEVKCIFNPFLQMGGLMEVKSTAPLGIGGPQTLNATGDQRGTGVNGIWRVSTVTHLLSAQTPNGPWFSVAQATTGGVNASPSTPLPATSTPASSAKTSTLAVGPGTV